MDEDEFCVYRLLSCSKRFFLKKQQWLEEFWTGHKTKMVMSTNWSLLFSTFFTSHVVFLSISLFLLLLFRKNLINEKLLPIFWPKIVSYGLVEVWRINFCFRKNRNSEWKLLVSCNHFMKVLKDDLLSGINLAIWSHRRSI